MSLACGLLPAFGDSSLVDACSKQGSIDTFSAVDNSMFARGGLWTVFKHQLLVGWTW